MKSTKCPQCGLVYWSTDPNCKRCGLPTADQSSPGYDEQQYQPQPQPQYSAQPAPVVNYADDAATAKLLKNLKSDSIFFYVIGGLQIILWLVIGQLIIVDGVLNITLSFLVYKFKSRVAALFLLGLTLLAILGAVAAIAAGSRAGLIFPIGLIIRLWAGIRMVNAAFKLQGYAQESPAQVIPPPPPNFYPETAQ
jgi:hypothetical protein